MHAATAAAGQVCRPADPGKGPDVQAHAWLHHASATIWTFDTTAAHNGQGRACLLEVRCHLDQRDQPKSHRKLVQSQAIPLCWGQGFCLLPHLHWVGVSGSCQQCTCVWEQEAPGRLACSVSSKRTSLTRRNTDDNCAHLQSSQPTRVWEQKALSRLACTVSSSSTSLTRRNTDNSCACLQSSQPSQAHRGQVAWLQARPQEESPRRLASQPAVRTGEVGEEWTQAQGPVTTALHERRPAAWPDDRCQGARGVQQLEQRVVPWGITRPDCRDKHLARQVKCVSARLLSNSPSQ